MHTMPTAAPLNLPVLCALVGSALGLPITTLVWEQQLSSRQRWLWLATTCGVALIAIASLWWLSDRDAWHPLIAALGIVALLMQRHIAAMLSRTQQEVRFGWMVLYCFGLIAFEQKLRVSTRDPTPTAFGLLMLSTVLLCMLMAMWNEWRGRIAPYRDDPLHQALYW